MGKGCTNIYLLSFWIYLVIFREGHTTVPTAIVIILFKMEDSVEIGITICRKHWVGEMVLTLKVRGPSSLGLTMSVS